MKQKSSSLATVDDGLNPFADALQQICGWEPPEFTKGIYFSIELTDDQYTDLQSRILSIDALPIITGVGAIDAADVIVRSAIECGIIEAKRSSDLPQCSSCGKAFSQPLVYTGYGEKEQSRCSHCLPRYLQIAIPEHWRHAPINVIDYLKG